MERVQYKKAMDDYNAGLSDFDSVDAPAAKQTRHVEDEPSTANPVSGSCHDVETSGEKRSRLLFYIFV